MQGTSFRGLFGVAAAVRAHAPGRVNLMGDHTDYSGGYVLPAAIPQTTRVELTVRSDRRVRVWSAAYPDGEPGTYELGAERRSGTWLDYVQGMTAVLAEYGLERGFDARIESDVPVGSGLSSSAALEIALGRAIRTAAGLELGDVELAKAGRRAENEFVGAPVGILDQMACSLASPSQALFLDTRSLEYAQVPLPEGAALIVIDSGIGHRHAGGEYATRRRECEEAARRLGILQLRDAHLEMLGAAALPEPLGRRARHVITENARVLETVAAFRAGDAPRAGEIFARSHQSLRDDFEVSVPDIDALVSLASGVHGVYGARLTGGGFGGSIVALAEASRARSAADEVVLAYRKSTGNRGSVIVPT